MPWSGRKSRLPSVQWRIAESEAPGGLVGHIEHSLFTERSPAEMRQAIEELSAQGADSFILDLRGNSGGLVSSAIRDRRHVAERGRHSYRAATRTGTREVYTADSETLRDDAPLIVLVDEDSASASEIVAGAAARQRTRALIVGQTTYRQGQRAARPRAIRRQQPARDERTMAHAGPFPDHRLGTEPGHCRVEERRRLGGGGCRRRAR